MTIRVCTPDEHGMTVHTNGTVGFAKLQAYSRLTSGSKAAMRSSSKVRR